MVNEQRETKQKRGKQKRSAHLHIDVSCVEVQQGGVELPARARESAAFSHGQKGQHLGKRVVGKQLEQVWGK